MERQRAYGGAFVAAVVAALLGALSLCTPRREPYLESAVAMYEEEVEVPADWASIPITAMLVPGNAESHASPTTLTELDGVYVEYTRSECPWGGSACASSPTTLSDVRFGGLDRRWRLDYRCDEAPFGPTKGCRRDFAIRHAGSRYVLTVHDQDGQEKPLGALSRTPPRLLAPALGAVWGADRVLLLAVAVGLFAAGLAGLARARRFLRLRAWIPTLIGGVAVLVDPCAPAGGSAYRDAAPIADRFVWRGNLGRARKRVATASRAALLLLVASAFVSLIALCVYP